MVRQRAWISAIRSQSSDWDALTELRFRLQELVGDDRWRPNEATVMRYAGGDGITPHRDSSRFVHAVAVVSLEGEAVFGVFDQRRRTRLAWWRCRPGDVVILQGPDPERREFDLRPVHAVSDPSESGRMSLTLRMDSSR